MKKNPLTNTLLALIAVALVAIAVRPYIEPAPAEAQSVAAHALYIEPGVQTLHQPGVPGQSYGKVVIDLRNGKAWGFPTDTFDTYPANTMDTQPVTSHPVFLGTFAFDEMNK